MANEKEKRKYDNYSQFPPNKKLKLTPFQFFKKMPDEIKLLIFSQLDDKSLVCAAQVCKNWNQVLQEDTFWKNRIQNRYAIMPKFDTAEEINDDANTSHRNYYHLYLNVSKYPRIAKELSDALFEDPDDYKGADDYEVAAPKIKQIQEIFEDVQREYLFIQTFAEKYRDALKKRDANGYTIVHWLAAAVKPTSLTYLMDNDWEALSIFVWDTENKDKNNALDLTVRQVLGSSKHDEFDVIMGILLGWLPENRKATEKILQKALGHATDLLGFLESEDDKNGSLEKYSSSTSSARKVEVGDDSSGDEMATDEQETLVYDSSSEEENEVEEQNRIQLIQLAKQKLNAKLEELKSVPTSSLPRPQ